MSARKTANAPYQAREPRVQLLPPLVKQRENARRTRRLLAFVIVVSIAVALGGVAFGYLRAVQAEAALVAERLRTEQILAEQAKYADAARLAALVVSSEEAQRQVTATEIDWLELIAEVSTYLPVGATFDKIAVRAPAPWETPLVPEGVLRAERVGILDVTVASADYRIAADFVSAIWAMEGVADVVILGSTNEAGGYLTTVSITFDEGVRSDRFLKDAETDEQDETSGEEVSEPQPTPTSTPEEEAETDQ